MFRKVLLSLLACCALQGQLSHGATFDGYNVWKSLIHSDYPYNPHVEPELWEKLKPYFLPYNSPIRIVLDTIFHTQRATLNRENLAHAGFYLLPPKGPGNLSVGSHPLLNGYLIKAYLDDQDTCEWENYVRRINGAKTISRCIKKHGFQDLFKVPRKWIYPLPLNPSPPSGEQYTRKNFVLLVEDMHVLGHGDNALFFQTRITPEILDKLYIIVSEEGLIDSVFRGNIPFNAEGQINFIDTEHSHGWPVNFAFLNRYLSPDMRAYWEQITGQMTPNE